MCLIFLAKYLNVCFNKGIQHFKQAKVAKPGLFFNEF